MGASRKYHHGWMLFVGVVIVLVVQCLGLSQQTHESRGGSNVDSRELLASSSQLISSSILTRSAADSSAEQQVMRVKLMHRDHPDSPFSTGSTSSSSFSRRLAAAVKRSIARREYLRAAGLLTSSSATQFQSPVVVGDGEYLMTVTLGTPRQTVSAIVDTGSDLVWVQCVNCQPCYPQTGHQFNPASSSTYTPASCNDTLCKRLPSSICTQSRHCTYQYTYGDQSYSNGDFAYETMTLDNTRGGGVSAIPDFGFGCGKSNQGTFAGSGGLMGLGQGPLSLPTQLSFKLSMPDAFSYCLVSLDAATKKYSPLFLGVTAPPSSSSTAVAAGDMTFTPIVSNLVHPTYYYVSMKGISVNGRQVRIPAGSFDIDFFGSGGVIFDSGTTITMLNNFAYSAVLQALQVEISYPRIAGGMHGLDLCYNVTGIANVTIPAMAFVFHGSANLSEPRKKSSAAAAAAAVYPLTAENTFVFVDTTNTVLCLAMAASQDISIIGNIQQADHHIVYDRVRSQIGWVSATC